LLQRWQREHPPLASGIPGNGLITLGTCGTLSPVTFVNPEPSQTVTFAVSGVASGLSTFVFDSSRGVTKSNIQFTPTLDDTFNVTFASTDSGSPAGITTVQLMIDVSGYTPPTDQPSMSPSPAPSSIPSSSPSGLPRTSPSCVSTFESISHSLCYNFAVHARSTVTFDGVMSMVHGGGLMGEFLPELP
jgi:hypothetical protein